MELENFPTKRPQASSAGGTPVRLQTNMFKYKGRYAVLHEYHVKFTPEVNRKVVFGTFMRAMQDQQDLLKKIAFDGVGLLVSSEKFPDLILTLGKERPVEISISYKNSYSMSDVNAGLDVSQHIQCIEAITRLNQRMEFVSDGGRVFGFREDGRLGAGLELRTGLFHSIKVTAKGFFLNADLSFSAFYRAAPLLELITQLYEESQSRRCDGRGHDNGAPKRPAVSVDLSRTDLGTRFYNDLEKFLRNVRVKTTHRSPSSRELVFRINGIQQEPASAIEFEAGGKRTTVAKYFAETYRPLRYPNLPVVVVKKGGMSLHFPMEVLEIFPDQRYTRTLSEDQAASIIKHAATPPVIRFEKILQKVAEFKALANNANENFGVVFDSKFVECEGRVLDTPTLRCREGDLYPQRGSWNLKDCKAVVPVEIGGWMLVAFRDRCDDFKRGIDSLMNAGSRYGVAFTHSPRIEIVGSINEFVKIKKAPFCLVVLPDKSGVRYGDIKRECETHQNVATQCILDKNVRLLTSPAFVGNLLLKINAKLGGVNLVLKNVSTILDEPTLVLGIDVSHPGGADLESPSIVAVVGGMNRSLSVYKTAIRQQARRQEIVGGLKDIVAGMLKSFYKSNNGTKPTQIIVFRDGVGDSMFQTVFHTEILAVKEACASLEASYSPRINFIIAQKRHSVRFNNPADPPRDGRTGNVDPGTVVEDIGHPVLFDFYLVSHHALQGTARPVRYLVLLNESGFGKDSLYNFIYGLCHLYARATKAVSVVPPIYYAHLAAARGRLYLEKDRSTHAVVMREHGQVFNNKLFYV
jgi:hypothetical protein